VRQHSSAASTATLLALIAAALAVVAPYTVRGIACGHDLVFHMNSWMEVQQQWREGVVYPRWAPNANYGNGEPRFIFYPPLSWMLGAALGSFIPWMFVPVAFDVCTVVLAGWSMYTMAREWFAQPEAGLIAVAYAINPYMLLTIYARSAYGELVASAFFPLLVLWIVRDRPAPKMLVPLALTIAGVWLANVPAAVAATYLTVLLLTIVTVMRRNLRGFIFGACAIALGLALAAFYIVPVLRENLWITMSQLLADNADPHGNLLFRKNGDPGHDQFLRVVSWLAVELTAVTAVAITFARRWGREKPRLWWSLAIATAVAFVLMLPVAGLAYRFLPDLKIMQFPWRWLLVVGTAYAVFVVSAVPPFRFKAWFYALGFVALIFASNRAFQPQCDPAETPFMVANLYRTGYGYMGTDEYTPLGGDNYEIKPDFPEYRLRSECCVDGDPGPENRETRGTRGARVTRWHASTYRKHASVESAEPVELVLRLMNYPAWRVEVNGAPVVPQSDDPTGRMVIALPAGRSEVDVRYVRTWDRWVGDGISLAAVVIILAFVFTTEGTERTELSGE
jgi:hypothetical protein